MLICPEDKCTGCCSCLNTCPAHCIVMEENEYGEIHPIIQNERCMKCGLCQQRCPANRQTEFYQPQQCFAAWSSDEQERKTSASGGLASVFSNEVISRGGSLFGASFENGAALAHREVKTLSELPKLKGSKYVQSFIGDAYKQVKKALEEREVLFIGTPCQVDGLKCFLGGSSEKLYTVDIICHGTPPNRYLLEHISSRLSKKKSLITDMKFRGENGFTLKAFSEDTVLYTVNAACDPYFLSFLKSVSYRESCYHCKYAQSKRVSDITIGDFWGLGAKQPVTYDTEHVSVALVNTPKGSMLLDRCREKLFLEERLLEEAVEGNAQLRRPSVINEDRKLFREYYTSLGFEKAMNVTSIKSLVCYNRRSEMIQKIAKRIPIPLKKTIKKLLHPNR